MEMAETHTCEAHQQIKQNLKRHTIVMLKDNKIKNIVFDLGGVLVGLDNCRCIEAFRQIGAHDIIHYIKEHKVEDLFLEQELGIIDTDAFCEKFRAIANCKASNGEICHAWNQLLTGIPQMKKNRILELRNKYRVFLLSNTNDIHWRKCSDDFLSDDSHTAEDFFEQVFLSYRMGIAKPDIRIFMQLLQQGHMRAEETLFVDDSSINCHAARQLGIKTLHETTGTDWLSALNTEDL